MLQNHLKWKISCNRQDILKIVLKDIFKFHVCDQVYKKNKIVENLSMNIFFSLFKSLSRGEQFSCDTGKLSVNSEKNRVHSTFPCKFNVFLKLYIYITVLSDLNLNRKLLWICTRCVSIWLFYLNKGNSIVKA